MLPRGRMNLLDALNDGSAGVRWNRPDLTVVRASESQVVVRDAAREVGWDIRTSPFALDLSPSTRDRLRSDVDEETAAEFADEPGVGPTIADTTFRPLVELDVVGIEGSDALRVVHRTALRPGNEIVIAD